MIASSDRSNQEDWAVGLSLTEELLGRRMGVIWAISRMIWMVPFLPFLEELKKEGLMCLSMFAFITSAPHF